MLIRGAVPSGVDAEQVLCQCDHGPDLCFFSLDLYRAESDPTYTFHSVHRKQAGSHLCVLNRWFSVRSEESATWETW